MLVDFGNALIKKLVASNCNPQNQKKAEFLGKYSRRGRKIFSILAVFFYSETPKPSRAATFNPPPSNSPSDAKMVRRLDLYRRSRKRRGAKATNLDSDSEHRFYGLVSNSNNGISRGKMNLKATVGVHV